MTELPKKLPKQEFIKKFQELTNAFDKVSFAESCFLLEERNALVDNQYPIDKRSRLKQLKLQDELQREAPYVENEADFEEILKKSQQLWSLEALQKHKREKVETELLKSLYPDHFS